MVLEVALPQIWPERSVSPNLDAGYGGYIGWDLLFNTFKAQSHQQVLDARALLEVKEGHEFSYSFSTSIEWSIPKLVYREFEYSASNATSYRYIEE